MHYVIVQMSNLGEKLLTKVQPPMSWHTVPDCKMAKVCKMV